MKFKQEEILNLYEAGILPPVQIVDTEKSQAQAAVNSGNRVRICNDGSTVFTAQNGSLYVQLKGGKVKKLVSPSVFKTNYEILLNSVRNVYDVDTETLTPEAIKGYIVACVDIWQRVEAYLAGKERTATTNVIQFLHKKNPVQTTPPRTVQVKNKSYV